MLDLRGTYNLHDGTNMGLTIRGVDGNNALVDSFIRTADNDIIAITGTFTQGTPPGTNVINFSTAHQPGLILFTTFYIGSVIPDGTALGGVLALAGTWHRQVIEFIGPGPKKTLKIVNQSGGWFADNHQVEIQ